MLFSSPWLALAAALPFLHIGNAARVDPRFRAFAEYFKALEPNPPFPATPFGSDRVVVPTQTVQTQVLTSIVTANRRTRTNVITTVQTIAIAPPVATSVSQAVAPIVRTPINVIQLTTVSVNGVAVATVPIATATASAVIVKSVQIDGSISEVTLRPGDSDFFDAALAEAATATVRPFKTHTGSAGNPVVTGFKEKKYVPPVYEVDDAIQKYDADLVNGLVNVYEGKYVENEVYMAANPVLVYRDDTYEMEDMTIQDFNEGVDEQVFGSAEDGIPYRNPHYNHHAPNGYPWFDMSSFDYKWEIPYIYLGVIGEKGADPHDEYGSFHINDRRRPSDSGFCGGPEFQVCGGTNHGRCCRIKDMTCGASYDYCRIDHCSPRYGLCLIPGTEHAMVDDFNVRHNLPPVAEIVRAAAA